MKTCLFTGFKPFLNYPTNPTEELALELDGQALGEYKIHSKILPVAYQQAIVDMQDFAEFDLILLNGLAFERKTICLETHAYNQIDSSRPDNRGLILEKQTIQSGGQDVLSSSFASPLLLQLTAALRHRGHAIQLSKDPGDRKSTRLNSSHLKLSRMPSSA